VTTPATTFRLQLARLLNQFSADGLGLASALNELVVESTEPEASLPYRNSVIGYCPLLDARIDAMRVLVVAYDNFGAMADVLANSRRIGFAFSSLARSTWEALGQAWYLLEPQTDFEMLNRYLAKRLSQLKTVTGKTRLDPTSEEHLIFTERRAVLTDAIKDAQLTPEKMPGYTELAASLYNTVHVDAGPADAGLLYSRLSSIAHGETGQLRDFVIPGSDSQPHPTTGVHEVELGPQDSYLAEIAGTLVTLNIPFIDRLHSQYPSLTTQLQAVAWAGAAVTKLVPVEP